MKKLLSILLVLILAQFIGLVYITSAYYDIRQKHQEDPINKMIAAGWVPPEVGLDFNLKKRKLSLIEKFKEF